TVPASFGAKLPDESAFGGELLDPVIAGVHHPYVAFRVRGDACRAFELTVFVAGGTPLPDKRPFLCELLHAVVTFVRDVHVPVGSYRDSFGIQECSVAFTTHVTESAQIFAFAVELLY